MPAATAPLYEQARLGILKLIQDKLSVGDLLPTQAELARKFGASLITIKRALNELAREDLIESIRGRGTVIKDTLVTDSRRGVSSWTDSVAGLGERPQTGWTHIARLVPEPRIRHLLNLKARQPVVTVERLRLINGRPICLMKNSLPASLVPDLETTGFPGESLYLYLRERYGLHMHKARESVHARQATSKEKKHLGRDAAIVLEIDRLTEDLDGQPVEWAQVIAHAERYTYQMQLINE